MVPSERSEATHQNTGNSTKQEKTLLAVRVVQHENGLPPLRLVVSVLGDIRDPTGECPEQPAGLL